MSPGPHVLKNLTVKGEFRGFGKIKIRYIPVSNNMKDLS